MLKTYIAASFPLRSMARVVRAEISDICGCTSRWLDDTNDVYGVKPEYASGDLSDVESADVLIVITGDTLTRGGRHAEVGAALAYGKPVFILGPREMVFHHHSECRQCDSTQKLKEAITTWHESEKRKPKMAEPEEAKL